MLFLAIGLAYALGGLSAGWWLVRRKTGMDLRTAGSGGTGATNAARVLGGWAFGVVLLLDAGKAALAVVLARKLAPGSPWTSLAVPAVVAGHIWPVTLRLRGGKGAGPLLGGSVVLNPLFLGAAAAGALVASLFRRRTFVITTGAAIAGIVAAPWLLRDPADRISFALAVALVVLAHRAYFVRGSSGSRSQPSPAAHGNSHALQNRDDRG